MGKVGCAILAGLAFSCLAGCSSYEIKFNPLVKYKIPPVDHATAVEGQIDEAKALEARAALPHNTVRERFELQRQAGQSLMAALGSQDYILIGEVYGGGDAKTNLATLTEALCQKAAGKGGDAVLIYASGIEDQPFVYSTPGYSTTYVYGPAYRSHRYARGGSTAYTTYTPGQTYSGVLHLPRANGLVFRYVPGVEQRREAMAALSEAELEHAMQVLDALADDESLTLQEVLDCWDQLLVKAGKP